MVILPIQLEACRSSYSSVLKFILSCAINAFKKGQTSEHLSMQSAKLGLGYILAQLAGGVIGAAAAFSSLPSKL